MIKRNTNNLFTILDTESVGSHDEVTTIYASESDVDDVFDELNDDDDVFEEVNDDVDNNEINKDSVDGKSKKDNVLIDTSFVISITQHGFIININNEYESYKMWTNTNHPMGLRDALKKYDLYLDNFKVFGLDSNVIPCIEFIDDRCVLNSPIYDPNDDNNGVYWDMVVSRKVGIDLILWGIEEWCFVDWCVE